MKNYCNECGHTSRRTYWAKESTYHYGKKRWSYHLFEFCLYHLLKELRITRHWNAIAAKNGDVQPYRLSLFHWV